MATEPNPYAAPSAAVDDVAGAADPQAAKIREEHIGREASIKSIGLLCYVSAFIYAMIGIAMLTSSKTAGQGGIVLVVALANLLLAVALVVIGRGMRELKPWVKVPAVIAAIFSTFLLPFSLVVSIYILWMIYSPKGRYVLSPGYAEIVAAAPTVDYRPAGFVKVLMVAIAILAAFFTLAYVFG